MAGGAESQANFTGWRYHFNSVTERGRFNFVVATYGSLFLGYCLYKMKKRGANKAVANK